MKSIRVSKKTYFHVVCFKIKSLKHFNENSYDVLLSTEDKSIAIHQLEYYRNLYASAGSTYTVAILCKSCSVNVLV